MVKFDLNSAKASVLYILFGVFVLVTTYHIDVVSWYQEIGYFFGAFFLLLGFINLVSR